MLYKIFLNKTFRFLFHRFFYVFFALAFVFAMTTCVKQYDPNECPDCDFSDVPGYSSPTPIKSVRIVPSTTQGLKTGEKRVFSLLVDPPNSQYDIFWKTSNPLLARVRDGIVEATKPSWYSGEQVTITAVVTNKTVSKSANVLVYVSDTDQPVTAVNIRPQKQGLLVDQSISLSAEFTPPSATNRKVTWKSSNSQVVQVDANGKAVAKSVGSATITVTTDDGGKTAQSSITVLAQPKPVTSVDIDSNARAVLVNDNISLSATVTPPFATNNQVTWSTSNAQIAQVDSQSGVVYANSPGKATIYATADGKTDSVQIEVLVYSDSSPTLAVSTFPMGVLDDDTGQISKRFVMSKTEVPYELWYKVRNWAWDSKRGNKQYEVTSLIGGLAGSNGPTGIDPPYSDANKNNPVVFVTWEEALIWLNAFTEYSNAKWGTQYTAVYRDGANFNAGEPIRSISVLRAKLKNFNASPDSLTGSGFRLPTSQEWEFAARYAGTLAQNGGTCASYAIAQNGICFTKGNHAAAATTFFNNTNALSGEPAKSANNQVAVYGTYYYVDGSDWGYKPTGINATANVATKQPNFLGLYDMSGNAYELCFDQVSGNKERRVIRGGSFHYDNPEKLQVGFHASSVEKTQATKWIGFRWVRSR